MICTTLSPDVLMALKLHELRSGWWPKQWVVFLVLPSLNLATSMQEFPEELVVWNHQSYSLKFKGPFRSCGTIISCTYRLQGQNTWYHPQNGIFQASIFQPAIFSLPKTHIAPEK